MCELARYTFHHPDDPELYFRAQYNPRRASRYIGSGNRNPPDGTVILNDNCFLCRENIRWQQKHAQVGFEVRTMGNLYHAWMNPFPLLPNHVVIAEADHMPQEWDMIPDGTTGGGPDPISLEWLLGDLCEIARRLPGHVGFYNGVEAGASVPAHLHFHFFHRLPSDPLFPLEVRQFEDPAKPGEPGLAGGYPVPVATWRGTVGEVVDQAAPWIRRWAETNRHRIDRLSSNLIVSGHETMAGVTLYFVPRDRGKQRWNQSDGLVGGLELLGELVFSGPEEKELLENGTIDYFYIERALASVHTPLFAP